jgi:hypothetical protein
MRSQADPEVDPSAAYVISSRGNDMRMGKNLAGAHFIRSHFARYIGTACEIAEAWKQAAIAKGFEEVTT